MRKLLLLLSLLVIFTSCSMRGNSDSSTSSESSYISPPTSSTSSLSESSQDTTQPQYGFTPYDIEMLAVLLCGDKNTDGDGEYDFDNANDDRYDQISLVLCVVMNRVRDERFPNTVEEVLFQYDDINGWQFAGMGNWAENALSLVASDIAVQRVTEWCNAYDNWDPGAQTIPLDHVMYIGDGTENTSYAWTYEEGYIEE